MGQEIKNIYHAAELFHLPSRFFNEKLVDMLEENGLDVFSPQRDGFEFSQLISSLQEYLSPKDLDNAMQTLIYAYDVRSISKSDVVLARVDEPPDPGVDTEILIANSLGIPVIAYRTDVRSPYGPSDSKYGGMHSFPVKTSPVIIIENSSLSPEKDFKKMVQSIITEVKQLASINRQPIPEFLLPAFNFSKLLFNGISDIHSTEGLKEISKRCLKYKEELARFGPRAVKI